MLVVHRDICGKDVRVEAPTSGRDLRRSTLQPLGRMLGGFFFGKYSLWVLGVFGDFKNE